MTNELRHNKTNKVTVRPAKTQISLGIRPVWSESSLSAWRKLGSLATHWAHSEDSDQTGQMPRQIWVFTGRTCHFVGFDMRRLIYNDRAKHKIIKGFLAVRPSLPSSMQNAVKFAKICLVRSCSCTLRTLSQTSDKICTEIQKDWGIKCEFVGYKFVYFKVNQFWNFSHVLYVLFSALYMCSIYCGETRFILTNNPSKSPNLNSNTGAFSA